MKSIILSFSLKGQEFSEIKERILEIKKNLHEDAMLIHGFMPRKEIEEKGFSMEVNDFFDEHFPLKLNMYNGGVLRKEMAKIGSELKADVFVIGEIKAGVKEEVDLYRSFNLPIIEVPLKGGRIKIGKITDRVKTYEDACAEIGEAPINESDLIAKGFLDDEITYRKLKTITTALNEGWKADWTDSKQEKHIPIFRIDNLAPSGFVFVCAGCYFSYASAGTAARLCFKDGNIATYAGKQFIELYTKFIK
ncbi:MAG: hypothetical protein LBN27_12220 [Prevotellaceae bacterium]|jgi:hypothetical protein|nr:hypothetical protein [Prevotellaceae bacterium]